MSNIPTINDYYGPAFYDAIFDSNAMEGFAALKTSYERLDFIYQYLVENYRLHLITFIPYFKNDLEPHKIDIPKERPKDWNDIKPLNNALARAGTNSLKLMIYSKRATAFFKMKLFKECIKDIDKALELNSNDPTALEDLKIRIGHLVNNLRERRYYQDIPELPTINSKIPSASQSIEIKSGAKFGKHLVATKDIKTGEVLVVEKPFISHLKEFDQPFCQECFRFCYNLVPCQNCKYYFFCSDDCLKTAWEKHHKYICPILPTMQSLDLMKPERLLNLQMTVLNIMEEYQKVDSYSSHDNEAQYNSNTYREIHTLSTNLQERSLSDLLKEAYTASIMLYLLDNYTDIFQNVEENNRKILEKQFKRMWYLHQAIIRINHISVRETQSQSFHKVQNKYRAIGLYAVGSLFNHSCAPNVVFHFYGTTLVVRAIKPIKAGEQLLTSYRVDHFRDSKIVRQASLIADYDFLCQCVACENNWPKCEFLDGKFLAAKFEGYEDILRGNLKKTKEMLPKLLDEYEQMWKEKKEPCKELFVMQQLIIFCYNNFSNNAFNRI